MATSEATKKNPLWLSIEEAFLGVDSKDFSEQNREASIQRIAAELDNAGYNVSRHGGNMLQLRWAVDDMRKVGRPFLQDFNGALAAFTLEDLAAPYAAVNILIQDLGKSWPKLKASERRPEVIRFVEKTKLDLLIARARELSGDKGIRLLIEEKVAPDVITGALEITADKLKQVNIEIEKERAARAKVVDLIEAVKDKSAEEKVKHLFANNISENLMVEIARIDQSTIDAVKQAMEAELKEKQRQEAEAAARRKEAAAGPPIEEIPPDQMLEYIESIREILEFSDKENEIRVMCEQSSIPKCLVDIAVSEPDKLDELEKKAGG